MMKNRRQIACFLLAMLFPLLSTVHPAHSQGLAQQPEERGHVMPAQAGIYHADLVIASCAGVNDSSLLLGCPRQISPSGSNLRISELMYNPLSPGPDPRSEYEFIELQNIGTAPINLGGVQFTTGIDYTFPSGTLLQAGSFVVIAKSSSHFLEQYGFAPFAEYKGKLSNAGEKLVLRDSSGSDLIILEYGAAAPWPIEADACGFSLVPIDAAQNGPTQNGPTQNGPTQNGPTPSNWRRSAHIGGSPNQMDPTLPEGHLPVLINEILAHTDLPQVDAIELYNPTPHTADLSGWRLVDKPSAGRFAELGTCAFVPPDGYLVLDEANLGFALSALGQRLSLESPDFVESQLNSNSLDNTVLEKRGGYRHELHFGASANGRSFGRYVTSTGAEHFPPQQALTLGKPNSGPLVGPIVISEIMYNPAATTTHAGDEYIELTNIGQASTPLYDPEFPQNRWRLLGIGEFTFPADTELSAQGTILVVAIAPALFRTRYNIPASVQIIGPYSGKLSNSGDKLTLVRPDRQNSDGSVPYLLVDEVEYSDSTPWPTTPDGTGPALRRKSPTAYANDVVNWQSSDDAAHDNIYLPTIQRP